MSMTGGSRDFIDRWPKSHCVSILFRFMSMMRFKELLEELCNRDYVNIPKK